MYFKSIKSSYTSNEHLKDVTHADNLLMTQSIVFNTVAMYGSTNMQSILALSDDNLPN